MSISASPAVARRRVRLALRSAREAKQLTQTDVAVAMSWSLSKVMRIEKGEVNVTANDLRPLLSYLDVRDPERVTTLLADARLSRQERYTVDPVERESLTPAMIELYQFEAEATTVRFYSNLIIPGRFQTRRYAEAMSGGTKAMLGPELANARLDAKLGRQRLVGRPEVTYLLLLDESVLLRQIGGPDILAEQLEHLLVLVDRHHVRIRITLLAEQSRYSGFYGPFQLCDLDESRSAFLYVESGRSDRAIHAEDEVDQHRSAFDDMWSSAEDEKDAPQRIKEAIERLKT
jgi:transcriptional regulator with XRE-family HTH domain